MRILAVTLVFLTFGASASDRVHSVKCGSRSVGELLDQGWRVVKSDYLASVSNDRLVLEDGSVYRADMTSGIFRGDKAILLAKHVRSGKQSGDIYNICAGGFDAWVSPIR